MRALESDYKMFEYVRDQMPERLLIYSMGDPFKWSWRLLGGMEKLFMNFVINPDFCLELARISTDYLIESMELAIDKGADVVYMDGDLATTKTTFMSPDHFRKFIKPFYTEICEAAHKRNIPIIKHSDGNLSPIMDDLAECGYDCFHPFQPDCMDIVEGKKLLQGKACVMGNIDCAHLLVFGTEEDVIESVKNTIKNVAPGGSYILSSSNSIHPGCKPENVIAMFNTANKYRNYPISID